jgi:hypothetical protein
MPSKTDVVMISGAALLFVILLGLIVRDELLYGNMGVLSFLQLLALGLVLPVTIVFVLVRKASRARGPTRHREAEEDL